MQTLVQFLRSQTVLVVSAVLALVSCFLVPPSLSYVSYVDWRVLGLLFSLMAVVAGLRTAGTFRVLTEFLLRKVNSMRVIALLLVLLCFGFSMFLTNDVTLITLVPFTLLVFRQMTGSEKALVHTLVLETLAANLGSMLTPVGNPQNLYLYSHYGLGAGDFFCITAPIWRLSLLLTLLLCLVLPRAPLRIELGEKPSVERKRLWLYLALFALCLLTVFRLIPWPAMLVAVLVALGIFDRKRLLDADFLLLLTFVAFFVFAGNLARLDAVDALLRRLLLGREYLAALLTSQVISNVPAALLLSGFTDNARELLLGVDVGGLGTPIASLASLISLKLYCRSAGAKPARYLTVFPGVNLLLLALLSCAHLLI